MSQPTKHHDFFTDEASWKQHHIRAAERGAGVPLHAWPKDQREQFFVASERAVRIQEAFSSLIRNALLEDHSLRVSSRDDVRNFFETALGEPGALRGMSHASELHTHESMHAQAFRLSGCQEYAPSSALSVMLRDTSIRKLKPRNIKFPHKSFVILVPPSADLWCTDPHGQVHRVTDIYVLVEDPKVGEPRGVGFLLHGASNDPENLQDNMILYTGIPYDEDVETFLVQQSEKAGMSDRIHELVPAVKWALNVVLYTVGSPEDCETRYTCPEREALTRRLKAASGKKREKLRKRIATLRPGTTTVVGRSVTHQYSREAPSPTLVKVAGHWHRYWMGEGITAIPVGSRDPTQLKLKWVQPYWKGAGNSEDAARLVRVLSPQA